jgi:hypothetical protein
MMWENQERIARGLMISSVLILTGFVILEYTLEPKIWNPFLWVPYVGIACVFIGYGIGLIKIKEVNC